MDNPLVARGCIPPLYAARGYCMALCSSPGCEALFLCVFRLCGANLHNGYKTSSVRGPPRAWENGEKKGSAMPYLGYGYGYGWGIDPAYLLLVIVSTVLGFAAQAYIDSTYKTWSRVASDGASGADVARRMLNANGCETVGIKSVAGTLTDHYDPRNNNLYLSNANLSGGSVASVAVACHEAGHAAQRAQGFAMMKVRQALVPVVNFTQNAWMIVFMLGVFMNLAGLTTIAIALFAFSVIFQIVTLPVEIDASRRAVAYIEGSGMSETQVRGARKVLTAAALTYVAAALTSILQLLYLLSRTRSNDD